MLKPRNAPIFNQKLSSGREIKFRPYNMGERNALIMSIATGEDVSIVETIKEIFSTCLVSADEYGVDPDKFKMSDFYETIVAMRIYSGGQESEIITTCSQGHKSDLIFDLNSFEIDNVVDYKEKPKLLEIGEYKYLIDEPTLSSFGQDPKIVTHDMFRCIIDEDGTEMYNTEFSVEELSEHLDSLTSLEFDQIRSHISTLPSFYFNVETECKTCEEKIEIKSKELKSFLV